MIFRGEIPTIGPGSEEGGGAGFALGPPDNLFGATSGDASAANPGVNPAANRAAAETTRDTYFTANPSNLASYDADSNLNIRLFFTVSGDNFIVHQIRQGSAWVDNGSVVGIQGTPGSGTDFSSISENHIPAIGASPNFTPFDSGAFVASDGMIETDVGVRATQLDWRNALSSASGVEEVCYKNLHRNEQLHPPLRRAELDASDRVRNKLWVGNAVVDDVRQSIFTETLVNPSFDLTVDAAGAAGFRIADFQVRFAADATNAILTVRRNTQIVYYHEFGAFTTGLQRISFMSSPGVAGEPGFIDAIDGDTYSFEVQGATLLGNTADVPFYTLTFRRWNYEDMAQVSDLPGDVVEITGSINISSANVSQYNRKVLYSTAVSEITITLAENVDFDYIDIVPVAAGAVLMAASGTNRINGESDIRLTEFDGARVQQVATGTYVILFESGTINDNFVDETSLVSGSTLRLGRTGTLANLDLDLSVLEFDNTFSYNPTGNQDIGVDLTSDIHLFGANTTSITILDGTTFVNNRKFMIVAQGTGDITFNLATSGFTFAGQGSGTTYTIAGESAVVFYVLSGVLYPVSDVGAGGGAVGTQDHPVIVARDTPPLATLASIANASINDNSGFWLVAADQIQTTEDTVDTSIQIRALRGDLLDANGVGISTTAVQKRTVRLAAGTQVRVFSSTDLRVISTPSMSQTASYPDIAASGVLLHINSQALYNTYSNRTLVVTGSLNFEVRLFQVQFPSTEGIVVSFDDIFSFRNDGTANVTVRTFQSGTVFTGGVDQIVLSPGQLLRVRPRVSTVAQTGLFEVVQQGQSTQLIAEPIPVASEWYKDETDSLATENPVRLRNRYEVTDGIVRDHIRTASFSNNPISLIFQRKNYQDDIAWIEFFSALGFAVPPLGSSLSAILINIAASLAWIESNIGVGTDFEFDAPEGTDSVASIGFVSGNTVRYTLDNVVPSLVTLNHEIRISGATNAVHNGTFAVTFIDAPSNIIHVTNLAVSDGTLDEPTTAAVINVPIYCDIVVKSDSIRQVNFNAYEDVARTSLVTVNPNWFNPDYTGNESVLAIGYNTDVVVTPPSLAFEDDDGQFFQVPSGPRGNTTYFDNVTPNYVNQRFLPLNFENIHIRTDGTADFYLNIHPDDLPVGERRRYRIFSDLANDNDDVDVRVGQPGALVTFDEGLDSVSLLNGTNQTIEILNNGTSSHVRLGEPFEKFIPSATSTSVVTPSQGPLAMSVIEIVAAESQDPNRDFYNITNNRIVCRGRFRYIFTYRVKLRFDGAEDTGLSFVTANLVPTRTRSAVTTDITRETGNSTVSILFIRNGNSADDNTKPEYTLTGNLSYFAEVNDEIGWELRFGTFPAGYSVSDLRQIERQYTITVKGGID